MYLPGLPALLTDFDTGASQIQLTLSACLLGLAVGQLVAVPLSDAFGRRTPLLVGLAGLLGVRETLPPARRQRGVSGRRRTVLTHRQLPSPCQSP